MFCKYQKTSQHSALPQLSTDEPTTLTMPSDRYLYLPVMLLMYLTVAVVSQMDASTLLESSGEAVTTEAPRRSAELDLEPLALFIQSIASEQSKRQLCNYFFMCNGSANSLEMYKMDLPQIRKKDKCFQRTFQKKKCLSKIIKGFQEYRKYLLFVSQWIKDDNRQVDAMLSSTKILVNLLPVESRIRERIAQLDKSNGAAFHMERSSKRDWDKQVTIHVILRNFALFMESTIRVIRFIK